MGFEVNLDKVVQATTVIEFVGIILDSEKFEVWISHNRLSSILCELNLWRSWKQCAELANETSLSIIW